MKLETVRIECGGGHYAVVFKDKLRRTARLHEAELRKAMHPIMDKSTMGQPDGQVKLSELEKMETMPEADFLIDAASIDNDAINEIFLVNQVIEWSLDGPVTHESIQAMPAMMYKKIVEEMDRLYKPVPLAGSAS